MSDIDRQRSSARAEWKRMVKFAHDTGIPVHFPWLESFDNFLRDMGVPDKGQKLKTTGKKIEGFRPNNCFWIDA